ncbi:MAG: 2Fe-2S iron-sulfur cluster-binding protein, partial [Armatimonadota bacterium]
MGDYLMSSSETITIVFEPGDRQAQVSPGATVMEAAEAAGISLWAPCGRRGICGQCRIRVTDPDECSPPSHAELQLLSRSEIEGGWRLACQAQVEADLRIAVPEHLGRDKGQVLESGTREDVPLAPNVVKRRLELPPPSLEDPAADVRRVERALELPDGRLAITPGLAADLPSVLRRHDFSITATAIGDSLVEVAGSDAPQACYGAALDIGTTTVVAYLL